MTAHLAPECLQRLLDRGNYTGLAGAFVDRVLADRPTADRPPADRPIEE